MIEASTSGRRFSPRASLAAIGLKLQQLNLFENIFKKIKVQQKIGRHTPAEKLFDAFIAILSSAHGLNQITSRLHSEAALQRAFGRHTCAEYSLVQDTLDACTSENVEQMQQAINTIFKSHSQAAHHNYRDSLQIIDIDMTGIPCGPKADLSCKGYFSKAGIRTGRQLGPCHLKSLSRDRRRSCLCR
jgi:hypothetical protein